MEKRKIYIGADSAGYTLKEHIKAHVASRGYEVVDFGTDSEDIIHKTNDTKGIIIDLRNNYGKDMEMVWS